MTDEMEKVKDSKQLPGNTLPGIMTYARAKELVDLPDEEYSPPALPYKRVQFDPKTEFGSSKIREHFCIDFDNWTFINHGAFGGALAAALETVHQMQIYIERQPLRFVDRELIPHMVYVIRRLAGFVSCDPRDLVLVSNATEGLNTVIRSLKFGKGDRVYYLNTRYYAVNKLFVHLKEENGIEIQEVPISFPSSSEEILNTITQTLHPDTKLAIFGHIPSVHPIVLPIGKIIEICHNKGVQVLIDGAHALGAIPLDLTSLNADYYVMNCHKWLCNPKGCAALYVNKKYQENIRCLTVSGGFGRGFTPEFIFRGLKDYSSFLALHTVLDFWQTLGPDNIRSYITNLAHKAGTMLADKWQTDTLFPVAMYGPMVLVRLPDILWQSRNDNNPVTHAIAEDIQNLLYYNYGIEVPIKPINGRLYCRISAHVYNEMKDYHVFADAVCELTEQTVINEK
ncbi:hypothetical protein QZH41_020435 [Actinostola sp. cb2023]|nr:hypothetical protein QZH41_020435 [Actinostola sp. cb2023]